MITRVTAILGALVAALRPRASLVVENLSLRQQLAVPRRAVPRPRLRPVDRAFWAVLSRAWSRWADALIIVKPATVVAWHRRGFWLLGLAVAAYRPSPARRRDCCAVRTHGEREPTLESRRYDVPSVGAGQPTQFIGASLSGVGE